MTPHESFAILGTLLSRGPQEDGLTGSADSVDVRPFG